MKKGNKGTEKSTHNLQKLTEQQEKHKGNIGVYKLNRVTR